MFIACVKVIQTIAPPVLITRATLSFFYQNITCIASCSTKYKSTPGDQDHDIVQNWKCEYNHQSACFNE